MFLGARNRFRSVLNTRKYISEQFLPHGHFDEQGATVHDCSRIL